MLMYVLTAAAASPERQPVLVELFTSEGCSSCPPADALLERLDRAQPIPGAQVIALSEHVDYWNEGGWTDPYSSHAFSERQEQYATRFGLSGPYTPEMVVDGRTEFVGSDGRRASAAITTAERDAKMAIRLTPSENAVLIEGGPLPAGKAHKAGVYVAYAADSGSSNVRGGENKGRWLHHVSVAQDLRQVGSVTDRAGFQSRVPLRPGLRLIVFVQERGLGRVWGAAMYGVGK